MRHLYPRLTYQPERVCEADRLRQREVFMGKIQASKRTVAQSTEEPSHLGKNERRLMLEAVRDPMASLKALYAASNLHPREGRQALDTLIAQSFARVHKLVRAGSGGQPSFLEILPAGNPFLAPAGLTPPSAVLKGSWKHNLYGLFAGKWAEAQGYRDIQFERTYGGKTFDLAFNNCDGSAYGLEICLTGSAERTAEQLHTAVLNRGIRVLAAFEKKTLLNATKKALEKRLSEDECECQLLAYHFLGEFVQSVLEGEQ
jgi:hypothetical protein